MALFIRNAPGPITISRKQSHKPYNKQVINHERSVCTVDSNVKFPKIWNGSKSTEKYWKVLKTATSRLKHGDSHLDKDTDYDNVNEYSKSKLTTY